MCANLNQSLWPGEGKVSDLTTLRTLASETEQKESAPLNHTVEMGDEKSEAVVR